MSTKTAIDPSSIVNSWFFRNPEGTHANWIGNRRQVFEFIKRINGGSHAKTREDMSNCKWKYVIPSHIGPDTMALCSISELATAVEATALHRKKEKFVAPDPADKMSRIDKEFRNFLTKDTEKCPLQSLLQG